MGRSDQIPYAERYAANVSVRLHHDLSEALDVARGDEGRAKYVRRLIENDTGIRIALTWLRAQRYGGQVRCPRCAMDLTPDTPTR